MYYCTIHEKGFIKIFVKSNYISDINCDDRFWVLDDADEFILASQQHKNYLDSDKDYMRFTILPTMACNANCVYCYENNHDRITMTKQTIMYMSL